MLGNCEYIVVYWTVDNENSTFHKKLTKKVKRFSSSAIQKKGYGYGEYACAKFLEENPKYIDNYKLNMDKTHWSDDGEFDWLCIDVANPQYL